MTRRGWLAGAALAALVGSALAAIGRQSTARILWWQGRPASWTGGRGVVLTPAGPLLALAAGEHPEPMLLRAASRELSEATLDERGRVWLVDVGGTVLRRREDGALDEIGRTPFDIPTLAPAAHGALWIARSARQFTFRPESSGAAVAIRVDEQLRRSAAAGTVVVPSNPFLSQLVNAGHVVALPDGGVVFAPFIRDEVIRYTADGGVRWTLKRGLAQQTPDPRLVVQRVDGRPHVDVDYVPVNLGLALGPDGRLYVLSTPSATTASSRLDAVDLERGIVVTTRRYPTALPTITVDASGRIATPDADALLPGVTPDHREPLFAFDVPRLEGGRLALRDFAGRVTLVNVWASWCLPCREEMPALDSLWRSYDPAQVAFAALSEDVMDSDARRFIHDHAFTFPVGLGGGRLRADLHYVGLPHSILVDAQGRVIRQWSGYAGASQMRAIGAMIDAELARSHAPDHIMHGMHAH